MKLKKLIVLAIAPLMFSCAKKIETPEPPKDIKGMDIFIGQLSHNIDEIWGVNQVLVASRQDYVKYTDNYYTRSHINFANGMITIGTLAKPKQLHSAIVHTLLMGEYEDDIDLFASGDVPISKKPLLRDLVMSEKGSAVATPATASNFATYLIKNRLQSRQLPNGRIERFVEIPMIANHIALRAKHFLSDVRKSSKRYNIDQSLIFGIMEVESSFNPYAVSYSNAIGLMQVVANTAGADVFKHRKWRGKPSKRYLMNPKNNIDIGTQYIQILQERYLVGIENKESLRYATISAYNSGAGAVLRVFDNDRKVAIQKINKLSPQEVYRILETQHPSEQARRYLMKVNKAQKNYRMFY